MAAVGEPSRKAVAFEAADDGRPAEETKDVDVVPGPPTHTLVRSASDQIRDSGAARPDMSVFMQKKVNSWCVRGVRVGARDISYYVVPRKKSGGPRLCGPKERLALLKHVSLVVNPGEVTYLMGPSGAGKSTLLDILAGRVTTGFLSGHVFFNDRTRQEDFFDNSAYVRQDDLHIPTLTVEETIRYAARLRIGDDYTEEERERRVNAVVGLLGLDPCRYSPVGDAAIRGISGGQKKRLSIAVEILHMPSLIFLDEPTSGLDSVKSYEVMRFARELSRQKRTILATVHQPSMETFQLASKVIVLKAGRLAYCGPTCEVVAYFGSPRLGYSSEGYSNPADFALAVVSGSVASSVHGSVSDEKMFSAEFKRSEYYAVPNIANGQPRKQQVHHPAKFSTSIAKQTATLIERFWVTQSRQHFFIAVTIGKNVLVSLIFGAIFFGMGRQSLATPTFDQASYNVASLWYFAVLFTILSVVQIIPQIFFYKTLYFRERQANMYSTFAYWATHAVINLPLLFVAHLVFFEIAYWLVGLSMDPGAHFFSMLVTFMNHLIAVYSAQTIAATARSNEVALSLFTLRFLFLCSFTGFTIPLKQVPYAWVWALYLCYPRWTYEALIVNEFRSRADFEKTLEFFNMTGWNMWWSVPILAGYMIASNVLLYRGLLPPKSKLQLIEAEGAADADDDGEYAGPTRDLGDGITEATAPVLSHTIALPIGPPVLCSQSSSRCKMQLESYRGKSMAKLPSIEGLSLLFKDIEYTVGDPSKPHKLKKILKGVSGHIVPGELCALMGGSGAGKSTLLDILAFRKTGGMITGDFYIGGKATRPDNKWNSYVMQDNIHIPLFTVRETLRFAAQLRLEESLTTEQRYKRAEDVMQMLGLEGAADVLVGDANRKGISGGQARRLTIGVEIMQLPPVIFLDEATTGLDSTISFEVMACVRAIADRGRTVVCTIHAPSEQVFMLFDKLILLALGRQTYFGSAEGAVAHFSTLTPSGWLKPSAKNPADFVMEASEGLLGGEEPDNRLSVREMSEAFEKGAAYHEVGEDVAEVARAWRERRGSDPEAGVRESIFEDSNKIRHHPRSGLSVVGILAWRQLFKLTRMRAEMVHGFVRSVVVGVFHGTLYYRLQPDAFQSRLSLLYFTMMYVMLANQGFLPPMFTDRLLMYRERGAGVYGVGSFWLSASTPFAVQTVFATALYGSIVYFMCGLQAGAGLFGYFLLVLELSSLLGLYFSQLIAFMVPSSDIAIAVFPMLLFVLVAFCGFVVRLPMLPAWLKWGGTISFPRWVFQGLVINEFKGNQGLVFYGGFKYSDLVYQKFLEAFGFDGYTKWDSVPILCYSGLALFCLSYLPCRFISFEKR